MPDFKAEDVWAVARAMLGNAISHEVEAPGGRNSYNECNHCRGHVYWSDGSDKIVHESNCPVLIARDLLTGAPS